MTRTNILIGTAVAATLGVVTLGLGTALEAQPYGGGGMMGSGGGMMGSGYGMMGGYGPGWMHGSGRRLGAGYGPENCPGFRDRTASAGRFGQQGDLNLSVEDVKRELQRWLTIEDNPRLQLGDVKEKDADTIEADIVTKDNSLVQRYQVNRKTGFYRPSAS